MKPGTFVRSRYRAPWYGIVDRMTYGARGWYAVVLQTHDRNGRPLRKRSKVLMREGCIVPVEALPRWPWWEVAA